MRQRLLLIVLLVLSTWNVRAQVLRTESFETDGNNVPGRYTSNTFNAGNNNYSFRSTYTQGSVPSGFNTTSSRLFSLDSSYFWASEGVNNLNTPTALNGTPAYVQLSPTTITGYANLKVTVLMADPQGIGSNGGLLRWEEDDTIRVRVRVDNGSWTTIGQFVGDKTDAGGVAGYLRRDVLLDGISTNDIASGNAPDGTRAGQITATLQPFTFSVPGGGTTLDVRIEIAQVGNSEEFAFDKIQITGTASTNALPKLQNIEATAVSYNEGDPAVIITNNLTVSDADNTTLSSASVQISGNFNSTEDELIFINQTPITGSYNSGTGILTLSGTASLAAYQTALRSVKYRNNDTADASALTRTVSFTVTDPSGGTNAPVTRNITVTTALSAASGVPYTESFESEGEGTRYASNHFFTQNAAQFQRVTTNPIPTGTTFVGIVGSNYWVAVNTAGGALLNPTGFPYGAVMTRQINTTGYANLHFKIKVGASIGTSNNNTNPANWRTSDYFQLLYRTAGSSTWTPFGLFRGTSTSNNPGGIIRQDTNPNGTGIPTGTQLTATLQDFDFTLPTSLSGQTLDFQMLAAVQDGVNFLAFDNIQITGTPVVVPTVTTGTATTGTSTASITGNTLTADGGANISDYGVVYVQGTGTPTTSNSKRQVGTTSPATFPANFTANLTGLTTSTLYTARAYATNSAGTRYGTAITFTPTIPLPVELMAFMAIQEGPAALLRWTTAGENNSDRFEVEASIDGLQFDQIGTVVTQGNTNSRTNYRFEDKKLLNYGSQRVYYRLRQVDYNGSFSYSPVRNVTPHGQLTQGLTLVPNPARTTMLTGAQAGATVEVFDAMGRGVLILLADANGQARLVLPVGSASGQYIVRSGEITARWVIE